MKQNFNGQIEDTVSIDDLPELLRKALQAGVKIFNYALTASQVKTLFNNGAINFGPTTGSP